ncbi:MAG: hypothetical protein CFE44_08045 [Burkholderiales bacterium PBB4]|nr:MAG: hypothetical protein CFE44_08045 [Burkholderiales bacterium PBB4]
MSSNVMVKVLGFTDVERHSINTMFRLSVRRVPSYHLWTAECGVAPSIALIDVDSYEACLEMESPSFSRHLKVIAVGKKPPIPVWRTLSRPVDWGGLVRELDGLFATPSDDLDIDLGDLLAPLPPPGVTVCLVVGLTPEQRLYIRARLALAGHTELDEAQSAAAASELLDKRHYDLMVIGLELSDADPWTLVDALKEMPSPPRSVVLASASPTWALTQRAEQVGCVGILEIPFNPRQVMEILQKV